MEMNNTETKTIDAEIVTTQQEEKPIQKKNGSFISESGDVNLSILSPEQIEKCRAITKNLSPKVIGSVTNYGIELQSKLADSGKSFLTVAKTSKSGEVGQIMADLVGILDQINISDVQEPNGLIKVMQKIPIVRNFVPSIKKTMRKYETLDDSIKTVEENIKATQLMTISDNNNLQVMFDQNVAYLRNLEDLIVAGTLAIEDAKAELQKSISEGADPIQISDQENFVNSLEKKVHDLKMVREIARQNLMEIRVVQRNNIVACDNAQSMLSLTIPAFRTQMSIASALSRQSDVIKVQETVRDKTNALLKANSDALYNNTIAVTRAANESIVSAEAIAESANKIKQTIEEIKKIQSEASAKRAEESKKLAEIEHNVDSIMGSSNIMLDTAAKGVSLLS